MSRVIKINAGGRLFQTLLSTVTRYPETRFARLFTKPASAPATDEFFLDVNPDVVGCVLDFLRSNVIQLPSHDDALRAQLTHYLHKWDLMPYAFGPSPAHGAPQQQHDEGQESHGEGGGGGGGEADALGVVEMPDVCAVQLCDHMQHDQGMKRHAMTITYGADGYQLRRLTQCIRRDLNTQLSSTYWQCYQTNERAVFFTTTKVANGAADLMTTAITQQVISHTERLGYQLVSSYVTLSPDVVHTSVRMLIHQFIFRRLRLPMLEPHDAAAMLRDDGNDEGGEEVMETFQNFEPRPVGPQKVAWSGETPPAPPASQRSRDLWTAATPKE